MKTVPGYSPQDNKGEGARQVHVSPSPLFLPYPSLFSPPSPTYPYRLFVLLRAKEGEVSAGPPSQAGQVKAPIETEGKRS